MFSDGVVLPDGAVLLHVGPFKTGTTAVQTAFDAKRNELRERGIWWASPDRRHIRAAVATFTGAVPTLPLEVGAERWQRLVHEVGASTERVVISSEFLSEGDAEAATQVVAGLGGPRTHVVITLRPLSGVLPSQWQQFAQAKTMAPYDEWLRQTLDAPDKTTLFWRRHDQPELVERWAAAAGAENVCVVALDEADRSSVTRAFEHLLRLEPGYLVPKRIGSNRSLTYAELELVRRLRETFRNRGWGEDYYEALMRHGAVARLLHEHQPDAREPRIVTPDWALKRARELGQDAAERIRHSGVRVIGDLARLADVPDGAGSGAAGVTGTPMLTVDAAYHAVLGAIEGSRVTETAPAPQPLQGAERQRARRAWTRADKRQAQREKGAGKGKGAGKKNAGKKVHPARVKPPPASGPIASARRWAGRQRRRLQRADD